VAVLSDYGKALLKRRKTLKVQAIITLRNSATGVTTIEERTFTLTAS
jgi:hypothetical protein